MAGHSKWGNYFQQTLAGVESRLDTILVGDEPSRANTPVAKPVLSSTTAAKPETGQSRSSSTLNTANDRLQERLARAIAAKNYATQKSDNPSPSNSPSQAPTPVTSAESPNQSSEPEFVALGERNNGQTAVSGATVADTSAEEFTTVLIERDSRSPATVLVDGPGATSYSSMETISQSLAHCLPEAPADLDVKLLSGDIEEVPNDGTTTLKLAAKDFGVDHQPLINTESLDLQRQEEIHGYIERIDALQAKLQYLSRESAESARKAASAAAPQSVDKKLAEKDEQIALLLQEGQKLSKTELKHMTVIKTLRAKVAEIEREALEAKKKADKLERDRTVLAERVRKAEATEKQNNQKQKLLLQVQKEIETLTADRNAKNAIITELKAQIVKSTNHARADEVKAIQDLLEQEKGRVAELEDDLSSLKIEKELAAGRAKLQIDELQSKNDREVERARVAEVEMRAEQQMLESRLELMRIHAEEVSSGATGDAQAKLLRQIETLQSQYAIASENWQGIEASLTSRATSLEIERDEALKREGDIRRKAREITVKSKRNEDELEDRHTKMDNFQQELAAQKREFEKLQNRAEEAESALIEAKRAFDRERQALKSEMLRRLDEERTRWREETIGQSTFASSRAESPVTMSHRSLTAEFLSLQNLQARRGSSRSVTTDNPTTEHRVSRKSSAQFLHSSGRATPQRQDSAQSIATNGDFMEPPSTNTMDHDDYFEHVLSPSSPHNNGHDVLSVSTVGAGPSVQLVERMSAAVRRLESEKVSTKEELARLSAQRDEARAQIVNLMHDAEAKKSLDCRVKELEEENEKINARYQTTLEMLGEKSELVEELRADVQDVKEMYRELVERTIK